MRVLLLGVIIISHIFSFSQSNFSDFLVQKQNYVVWDSLINKGDFKSALSFVSGLDEKKIPKDYLRSYYAVHSEIYLNLGNEIKSKENLRKATLNGTPDRFIEYLRLNYDTVSKKHHEIILKLEKEYPNYYEEYRKTLNEKLVSICDRMFNDDQSVRYVYHSMIQSNNIAKKDSILEVMKLNDKINIGIYDSIVNVNGWVFRERGGYVMKNYHIIVAHNESKYRYKYVKLGYDLAQQNKIEWQELMGIQAFAFIKSETQFGNARFIENWVLDTKESVSSDFNLMIAYCLAKDIMDGGTFNGKEKRIKLYLNAVDKDNLKSIEKLELLKKELIRYGADSSKIEIDKEGIYKNMEGVVENCIGIEYL